MPYIKHEGRKKIDGWLSKLDIFDFNIGEMNYLLTKLLLKTEPTGYCEYNELIGLLECVKLELYRRKIAVYEDLKCKDNGEVYL